MKNPVASRIGPWLALIAVVALFPLSWSQDKDKKDGKAPRGSLVEDKTARNLLQAGDDRLEGKEAAKAVEIWQSVIERYPRSKHRFDAHMRLGSYLLDKERAYDRARTHFEAASGEDNANEAQRATATLKMGVCFYETRNFGKCFKIMRDVIEHFPVSPEVNQAYYYIGLGHFQQGHYSRAIAALENVGTALTGEEGKLGGVEKVEAGKRLFIRIEDADLAALEPGKTVKVQCETAAGDSEVVECHPIGRNVRVVLGSIPTALGKARPGNGRLEVRGGDKVKVTYLDHHTSAGNVERKVIKEIAVVGNAKVAIMDGAYAETLGGVVLGKDVNLQVIDADMDMTDGADILKATVEVYREKTQEEINAEAAPGALPVKPDPNKLDRFKKIDKVDVVLTEVKIVRELPAQAKIPAVNKEPAKEPGPEKKNERVPDMDKPEAPDNSVHSGVFRAVVPLVKADVAVSGDQILQAQPNDLLVVTYVDNVNTTGEPRTLTFRARCVEGSLGGVRVTQTQISDKELRVKTQLKTASAPDQHRQPLQGIRPEAERRGQVSAGAEDLRGHHGRGPEARRPGPRRDLCPAVEDLLRDGQARPGRRHEPAAAARVPQQRVRRRRPGPAGPGGPQAKPDAAGHRHLRQRRPHGEEPAQGRSPVRHRRVLRGHGQGNDQGRPGASATQMFDRSFQEYKKVFDIYPDSGRVGEAVAKMANYYYQQKDYARAIDTFESVLQSHPDAKFLDVILFNYGRCLYRLDRKADARKQFDHLIQDFPESPLAADAKKISESLRKAGF